MKPVALTACLCACLLAACVQAPNFEAEAEAHPGATLRGVVPGFGGATVCIDRNRNARCDAGEPSTVSDGDGGFELPGSGALVAETTGDARSRTLSGSTGIVLRAPLTAGAGTRIVLSSLSTELVALMDANGGSLAAASATLASRLGVPAAQLLADPASLDDTRIFESELSRIITTETN